MRWRGPRAFCGAPTSDRSAVPRSSETGPGPAHRLLVTQVRHHLPVGPALRTSSVARRGARRGGPFGLRLRSGPVLACARTSVPLHHWRPLGASALLGPVCRCRLAFSRCARPRRSHRCASLLRVPAAEACRSLGLPCSADPVAWSFSPLELRSPDSPGWLELPPAWAFRSLRRRNVYWVTEGGTRPGTKGFLRIFSSPGMSTDLGTMSPSGTRSTQVCPHLRPQAGVRAGGPSGPAPSPR